MSSGANTSSQPPRQVNEDSPTTASTKRGPLKAVQVFSLKQSYLVSESESLQKDSCKLWSRNSPDLRFSPERKSPGILPQSLSPNLGHTDKVRGTRHSPNPAKLRPCSADAVVPSYLTGQWPREVNTLQLCQSDGVYMCDKSAQTVELEVRNGGKKQGHRRSASYGQGDQLQLQFIKQQLNKSKEGSKHVDGKRWASPVPSSQFSPAANTPPALYLSQNKAARLMPKHNMNRYQRNSVEGLNMEIEKLVSSITASTISGSLVADVFKYDIPEGHRAPGPEPAAVSNMVSVVTQTSDQPDMAASFVSKNRSVSVSPDMPQRSGSVDIHLIAKVRCYSCDGKLGRGDTESSPEPTTYLFSPNLKKSCPFVREPPDGCEKVTVVEEFSQPKIKEPLNFPPVKPNMFVFKPSQGSAFCPLIKKYEYPINYTGSSTVLSGAAAVDE